MIENYKFNILDDEKIGYGKKVLYAIDYDIADWNDVDKVGWYSGNNALNSPESNIGWFQVLVLSENGNKEFLHCIGFTTNTKKIYGRVSKGIPDWTNSKWFSYN
jgi:hypothetical protein